MKKNHLIILMMMIGLGLDAVYGQTSPAERRAFRQFTSPEELVSVAPTTALDKALLVISEVSQKFIGKIIIDPDQRDIPVNVDIQGLHWRDALETICRKNQLWYNEYQTYMQIISLVGGEGRQQAGAPADLGSTEIQKEFATIKSREIKISAVFFEVSLTRLDEVGLNWNFLKNAKEARVDASFFGGDQLAKEIFTADVTPKVSFANINILAKMFSNYELGEILSGPQLIVRSGEEGRIQVGQDFSVKERDFAGNVMDKFYSAGTIIRVKPQVVTEQGVNFVHLLVDVERSSVVPGALSTIINKTKANTNLLLLDGEETIIGGLYNNENVTIRTGIPFLKDLPWWFFGLRYIFGYEKEEVKKKELVILMKAELIPTLQERIQQRAKDEQLFEQWKSERMKDELKVKGDR